MEQLTDSSPQLSYVGALRLPKDIPAEGFGDSSDPQATQFASGLANLEEHFERALRTMRMFFQPIVEAANPTNGFGYEALMRPAEPELPHPGAILDAAEQLHRLQPLGRVLRNLAAARFASRASSLGCMFVNLHAADLLDRQLRSPYSPLARIAKYVVLEITERASLDHIPDVCFLVAELRQMGFRIAIDDFGAGHSRMHQFSPLDTDFVKLDMSLVRDIHLNEMKRKLTASIVQLCTDQGIQVIGEGVESAEEGAVLRELGCQLLQGFYYARPGPEFV